MRKERLMEQQVSWRRDMGQTKSSTVPKTTIANARGRNLGYIFQDKKNQSFLEYMSRYFAQAPHIP